MALPGRQRDAVGGDGKCTAGHRDAAGRRRRPPRCRRYARTPARRHPADCPPAHSPQPAPAGPSRPKPATPNRRHPRRPPSCIVTCGPGCDGRAAPRSCRHPHERHQRLGVQASQAVEFPRHRCGGSAGGRRRGTGTGPAGPDRTGAAGFGPGHTRRWARASARCWPGCRRSSPRPAGTCGRGVSRREICSASGSGPRYGRPGANPTMYTCIPPRYGSRSPAPRSVTGAARPPPGPGRTAGRRPPARSTSPLPPASTWRSRVSNRRRAATRLYEGDLQRLVADQQRAVARRGLDDAVEFRGRQRKVERDDLCVQFGADRIAELDAQRGIAKREEARICDSPASTRERWRCRQHRGRARRPVGSSRSRRRHAACRPSAHAVS